MTKIVPYRQGTVKPRPKPKGKTLKQVIAKSVGSKPVTVKPASTINPNVAKANLAPKPTAAQARQAYQKSVSQDPAVKAAIKQSVKSGQGTVDKKGKFHPYPVEPVAANNLSLGGLLDRVSRLAIGGNVTNLVEGKSFDPTSAAIEGLTILPFGRIGKTIDVAAHIGEGIKAGEEAGKIIQGAKQVAKYGKIQERNLKFGPVEVKTAYSTSRSMRGVQKTLDANTRRIIKAGADLGLAPHDAIAMAKGPSGKIARFHSGLLVRKAEHYSREGINSVSKMLGGISMKPEQWVALKAVAKGIHPEQTIQNNLKLIAKAEIRGDTATAKRLAHDNKVLEDSKKYLKTVDVKNAHPSFENHPEVSGKVVELRSLEGKDKGLQKLWFAWENLKRVSKEAETSAIHQGHITPEQAFNRIHEPGRVDLGAQFNDKEGRLVGHEDFLGGRVYYPSQEDSKYFRSGQYKTRSTLIPYKTRGESPAAFKGVLQQTGRESYNVGKAISRRAMFRQSQDFANRKLMDLRKIAMKDTIPVDAKGQLLKTYHGIRMEPEVPHLVQSDFIELGKKIDLGVPLERTEAQAAANSFRTLRDFQLPATRRVAELGGEVGVIPKFLLGAMQDDRLLLPETWSRATKTLASMSQLMKDMLVYTKFPGHIPPRFISNAIMALPSSGKDFAPAALTFIKLAKKDPELSHWITTAMGRGYFASYAETEAAFRATQKISQAVVKPIEFTADRFIRDSTFLAMAIKASDNPKMSYAEFVKYLKGMRDAEPGTREATRLQHILQLASEAAGEYSRLSNVERNVLSNILFLYRWVKASTIWTGRFALEHPVLATGAAAGAYEAYDPARALYERFGLPYPGGQRGSIATSLPFTTPFEYGERISTIGRSGPPGFGESPGDVINPFITSAEELAFGRDPILGTAIKGNRLVGVGEQFWKQTPPGALVGGKKSLQDRIKKFLIGNLAPQDAKIVSQNAVGKSLDKTLAKLISEKKITKEKAAQIKAQVEAQYPKVLSQLKKTEKSILQAEKHSTGLQLDALKKAEKHIKSEEKRYGG